MTDSQTFVGVRIQGGLMPAELLSRVSAGRELDGLTSADYHLAAGETVREAANRVWAYLRGVWTAYQDALEKLPGGDRATSLTRERWLLVMLDQLGYGRVPTAPAGGIQIDGKPFPVSHVWQPVPIHLLGARIDLDRRTPGVAGAAGASPQSMVQELLNRTDDHLWALLSNGRLLRLLRDSTSLVGSAYVEFDLEAIFDGDLFSDFLLLYTLCHQSRVEVRESDRGPSSCWLEVWRETALESGTRALNQLRDGVVEALETLGGGFLAHPDNAALRARLDSGELSASDINHALLRVVYRLLFTFVAEDRGALLDPAASPLAVTRYHDYFSVARLRRIARRRRGGRHGDKWRALCLVWQGLGAAGGRPELGLAGIGGLFEPGELDVLQDHALSNESLLSAVRALSIIREPKSGFRRVVDHRNLGAEELGSIYESLLEYVPHWDPATKKYSLGLASGNARKTSGSYYTPTSLIDCLLDSALDPVLDDAEKNAEDPEAALLAVTVCDPACGSGHFLVGAARRIAKRVAGIRTGDPEPPPEAVRSAMRDVVARCIYGVDVNPLAAELAKVSLWLEALEPGRPLAFLDAQIKVGNALIGATPALLAEGIPDEAFKPIEGDDKKFAAALAKQNKAERSGQGSLLSTAELRIDNTSLIEEARQVMATGGLSLTDIHIQQQRLKAYLESPTYQRARDVADAWCAAFVWPKTPDAPHPVTHQTLIDLEDQPELVPGSTTGEIARLAGEYRFFHWHLEFPHIFPTTPSASDSTNAATGWAGGFRVVLGNPPWERVKLQEQEFFAKRDHDVAGARNAASRKRIIAELVRTNPSLSREFLASKRRSEGESQFLRNSGRLPLSGRGDINTYAAFAELGRLLMSVIGRMGMVLPTGIATDATTQFFFRDLVEQKALLSLYDFDNKEQLFPGVGAIVRFCLLTLSARPVSEVDLAFLCRRVSDIARPGARVQLTADHILKLNPNTGTLTAFKSSRDAEIALSIYEANPVLQASESPSSGWQIGYNRMFDMANDSGLFQTLEDSQNAGYALHGNRLRSDDAILLPLYEPKFIHLFDHRFATYHGVPHEKRFMRKAGTNSMDHRSPEAVVLPRYWVDEKVVASNWPEGARQWSLAMRDMTNPVTNARTAIFCVVPFSAYGHSAPLLVTNGHSAEELLRMLGNLASFPLDYCVRQKMTGGHLTLFLLRQIPVISAHRFERVCSWTSSETFGQWIERRVFYLTYTATDIVALAEELGVSEPPYEWDDQKRKAVEAELHAAFFHLYGIEREDVDYIMETFPIVKRKDIAAHGEYRTKRMILEVYDQMAEAIRTGVPYTSPFEAEFSAGTRD